MGKERNVIAASVPGALHTACNGHLVWGLAVMLLLLAPQIHAQTKAWTWKDRSGEVHSRAELVRILALQQEWVSSHEKEGAPADLSGAVLVKADLRKVNLSGADLEGADLSGADLTGAALGEVREGPSPPMPPWNLRVTSFSGGAGGGESSTYLDLLSYFLKGLWTPAPTIHRCSASFAPDVLSAKLSGANLRGAVMVRVWMYGANLKGADLTNADLDKSQLYSVDMEGAVLDGVSFREGLLVESTLRGASLQGADISGLLLTDTDLRSTNLVDTRVDRASFDGAVVCGADFEPTGISDGPRALASARGLEFLIYQRSPAALTELRQQFRDRGFAEQDREVTYALRWHEDTEYWGKCVEKMPLSCVDFVRNELLFNWTCGYGLEPERPLLLLAQLWFICGLGYWCFIRFGSSRRSGIFLVPLRNGTPVRPADDRIRQVRLRNGGSGFMGPLARCVRRRSLRPLRVLRAPCKLLRIAFWFSSRSALSIGFRDVDAGRWIRLITLKPYDMEGRGWPRFIAGVQALCSVYLLALWLLTYFGRPFG